VYHNVYIVVLFSFFVMAVDVNWMAVVIASVASMVIGALWYSPMFFGGRWMKLSGVTKKDLAKAKKRGMTEAYVTTFFSLMVMGVVVSLFFTLANIKSVGMAFVIACLVWIAFMVPVLLSGMMWENKPSGLFWIGSLHYLVSLLVMSGILVSWA
jgi:hypothetical protein